MLRTKITKLTALNLILIMLLSQASFAQDSNEFSDDSYTGEFDSRFSDNNDGMEFKNYPLGNEFREGFNSDFGGLSKEEIIFGKIFEILGEVDESEVMPYCDNPGKIAEIVISKVKVKIGDISGICEKIGKDESN